MKPSTSFNEFLKKELENPKIKKAFEKEDLYARIAIKIAMLREKKHMTQLDLAKKLKTTQQVISRIENGNQNLTIATLDKIASVFNKKIELRFV